jgi:hypothetical protein
MAMPDGYDTQLGERGSMLSGGQRQRIAIARAFIRETPILILDEPTTGLDLESTQLVLTALRSLMDGKTTIIISHDPGLIRCADRILVIADGYIAESGQHEDLISARGLYAELYLRELDVEGPRDNGDANGPTGEWRFDTGFDHVPDAPRPGNLGDWFDQNPGDLYPSELDDEGPRHNGKRNGSSEARPYGGEPDPLTVVPRRAK